MPAFMMWIKITAIADPYESDWCFISDQICEADSSRETSTARILSLSSVLYM